ncbi:MAG: hypothetical protein NXI31_07990 [bacterium]|nr:hypothetical protein [bacterium]
MKPLVAIAIGASGSLDAQLDPRATSAGVVVQNGPVSSVALTGHDVTTGLQLHLADVLGQADFGLAPAWGDSGLVLAWNVAAVALRSTSVIADGATLHALYLGRPTDGRFVIDWLPSGGGTGVTAFEFDLHGDGVSEAAHAFQASTGVAGVWPVVLPAHLPAGRTDVVVRVSARATAGTLAGPWGIRVPFQGDARGRLEVRFEPDSCSAVAFGSGCGAPATKIAGNFFSGATVRSTPGPTTDFLLAVLGVDQTMSWLPLTPFCPLHTTPIASLLQARSLAGENSWTFARPVGAPAIGFAAQVLGLDLATLSVISGPAYWVDCH